MKPWSVRANDLDGVTVEWAVPTVRCEPMFTSEQVGAVQDWCRGMGMSMDDKESLDRALLSLRKRSEADHGI